MRFTLILPMTMTILTLSQPAAARQSKPPALQAVPFTDVRVADEFWTPRIKLNREKVLPHNFKLCEETGRIDNFLKAAGKLEGKFKGLFFDDSDVYKVLEGAAYSLAHQRDEKLEAVADAVIEKIVAAQRPNGYLNTYFTLAEPNNLWNEEFKHETYCAGHLIEAAVAYYQATGKRKLLDAAIKFADHMDTVFGPGKQTDVSGHEEVELALVKLWRLTGEERYLKLAQFFLERRGHKEGRKPVPPETAWAWGEYNQDHAPIREQNTIVGHAVRAMYLYSAVADIAAVTGDAGFLKAMDSIWRDVTQTKMYITGGIGPSAQNEGFTVPYDLPNDSAYAETCASIGMVLWNHRMALLHADAKYSDVVERALYNGLLSGVSLDGEKYFYVNPLASRGWHHRRAWFDCSCCPTNVARFLPTVGGYSYAHNGQSKIYVNHFVTSRTAIMLGDAKIQLTQATRYPWDGTIEITVQAPQNSKFVLYLRVPGWCEGPQSNDDLYRIPGKPARAAATVKINGQSVESPALEKGYIKLERAWQRVETVTLHLPMPVRRVYAHSKVEADAGRVALQRGPIVYCLEAADNNGSVRNLALPPDAELTAEHKPDLLGGVTVLRGTALSRERGEKPGDASSKPTPFTAVPYYAWDNRAPGQMLVWLPEDVSKAEPRPVPTIASQSKISASHRWRSDRLEALNDQVEPANSNDHGVPRLTWWDHKGTTEWVQYEFASPQAVSGVEVYWFDDREGGGGCRVPQAWRILSKDGEQWKPLAEATPGGVAPNQYNCVTFPSVTTAGLRLEVQLQKDFSGGILEWRVLPANAK